MEPGKTAEQSFKLFEPPPKIDDIEEVSFSNTRQLEQHEKAYNVRFKNETQLPQIQTQTPKYNQPSMTANMVNNTNTTNMAKTTPIIINENNNKNSHNNNIPVLRDYAHSGAISHSDMKDRPSVTYVGMEIEHTYQQKSVDIFESMIAGVGGSSHNTTTERNDDKIGIYAADQLGPTITNSDNNNNYFNVEIINDDIYNNNNNNNSNNDIEKIRMQNENIHNHMTATRNSVEITKALTNTTDLSSDILKTTITNTHTNTNIGTNDNNHSNLYDNNSSNNNHNQNISQNQKIVRNHTDIVPPSPNNHHRPIGWQSVLYSFFFMSLCVCVCMCECVFCGLWYVCALCVTCL